MGKQKKQATTAVSSCESEYIALGEATKEACFFKNFFHELFTDREVKITLCSDNQGAIALSTNPGFHKRSKHIDVRHHFIREKVKEKSLTLKHVPTKLMVADILTKPLPKPAHQAHTNKLLK